MYDREHSKIGFWKTNCSELWERLQMSGSPPPMSSAPNEKNSTTEISPTLAPNEAPHYLLPGFEALNLFNNFYYVLPSENSFQISACIISHGKIKYSNDLSLSYGKIKYSNDVRTSLLAIGNVAVQLNSAGLSSLFSVITVQY